MNDTDQAITMMLQDNAILITKCERLQAENKQLQEQLEYEHQTSQSRLEKIDHLKIENDKLRELIWNLVLTASNKGIDIMRVEYVIDGKYCTIDDCMRELGVSAWASTSMV